MKVPVIPGLAEQPKRRFTRTGTRAHLVLAGKIYSFTPALCGTAPQWPTTWYGGGSKRDKTKAEELEVCVWCAGAAKVKAADARRAARRAHGT